MTRVLRHCHATSKWVWGSPAATTTASCHQKATPPYGHARKMKISDHSGVYVALEEYAAEHVYPPPPSPSVLLCQPYSRSPLLEIVRHARAGERSSQWVGSIRSWRGTVRTNVTQERIKRCELILGAILRERPEFFSVRLDNPLCVDKMKMKTGGSHSDRRHILHRTPISGASTQRRDNENGKERRVISLRTLNLLSTLNTTSPSAAVCLGQGEGHSTHHHLCDQTNCYGLECPVHGGLLRMVRKELRHSWLRRESRHM